MCGWGENENGIEGIKGSDSSLNMSFLYSAVFQNHVNVSLTQKIKNNIQNRIPKVTIEPTYYT